VPLSVFIIAKNEADRIVSPINSVISWADEVIVIDSGSVDETVAISKALGARVYFREWEGYGQQKIYGETLCRNDWILNIDADETVSAELAAEIIAMFAGGAVPAFPAYHLPIKIVSRFAEKPGRFAPSNSPVRLYNKCAAGFKDSIIHDSVVSKNGRSFQEGWLRGIVHHRCFRSYRHAVEKINFYSSMQAEDMLQKGRCPSMLRLFFEPVVAFLKAYTVRRYVLLGADGFIESIIYAFARTLRLAKAREKFKEQAQSRR
jgi:glycosyltransferase involved in cell wall biosynthesis